MRRFLLAAGALAASLCISPAFADRACLHFDYIKDWRPINDRTLIVTDDANRKFKLHLIGTCYNLDGRERLAFKSRGSIGISCVGVGDEVIAGDSGPGPSRCAVTHVEAYTPDMEKADRAAASEHQTGYGGN